MSGSSISVAVRVRPPTEKERAQLPLSPSTSTGVFSNGCLSTPQSASNLASHRASSSLRPIIKVLDQRVLIFDPPETNPLQQAQRQILARFGGGRKVKDMRFCFDKVFDETASQEDVFQGSAKELVSGVLDGFNATVFAYGATGCGKTHTITGTPEAPGIVYLLMRDLFERMHDNKDEMTVEISLSYLEVYNETIRDLFNPASPPLNLREVNTSVSVPGLSCEAPSNASDVIRLISAGNAHRTVHGTDANAVSSRSHAVLSVNVRRKPRTGGLSEDWTVATLSVIDLAGSERASATRNKGDRLLEGANINRSLLALGNCINALCDPRKRGHVPYRDSKLTRLLKHSLGGNCRTLMIVCVAPTSAHYEETHNTLQYANRAKEIKTKATRNIVSVDRHVSQYVQVIFQLREELAQRKSEENDKLDRAKITWERQRGEVEGAVTKARRHWDEACQSIVPAGRAKGKLKCLSQVSTVLSTWASKLPETSMGNFLKMSIVSEMNSFESQIQSLKSESTRQASVGDNAKLMYEALVASLARSIEVKSGSPALTSFNDQVKGGASGNGLEGLLTRLMESAEKEGSFDARQWALTKFSNLTHACMAWVAGQITNSTTSEHRQELASFLLRLQEAGKSVVDALTEQNATTLQSSAKFSFSAPKVQTQPKSILSSINFTKSTSLFPSTSLPTKHFSKPTTFGESTSGGILKASSSSLGETRKVGGVRWRDETGDGENLESFNETTNLSVEDEESRDVSASLLGRQSDGRMKTNFLGRPQGLGGRIAAVQNGTSLQSLGEEEEEAEEVDSFNSSKNLSFNFTSFPTISSQPPSTSTIVDPKRSSMALSRSRRSSSIGPIRSVKTSRRVSLAKPRSSFTTAAPAAFDPYTSSSRSENIEQTKSIATLENKKSSRQIPSIRPTLSGQLTNANTSTSSLTNMGTTATASVAPSLPRARRVSSISTSGFATTPSSQTITKHMSSTPMWR